MDYNNQGVLQIYSKLYPQKEQICEFVFKI